MGRCRSIELSWGGSVGWLPRFILGRLINDSGLHYVGHRQVWRGEEEGSALRMCRVGMQDGAPFLPNSTLQCARRPGASHRY